MSTQVLRAVTGTKPAERILVVEDDRAVQKALRRLFEAEGFAVDVESDGKAALEAFRGKAETYAEKLSNKYPRCPLLS